MIFNGFVYAADAGSAAPAMQGGGLSSFVPMLLIIMVFYFIMIRPQQKKMKEHQALLESLKRGDRILTSGGLFGEVHAIKGNNVEITVANGVRVTYLKSSIASIIKPEAVNDKAEKAAAEKTAE